MRLVHRLVVALVVTAASAALAACGGSAGGGGQGSSKLTLVAYSTPKEAYGEIIPAFDKTAQGKGIGFQQSYGASGDQSRAVQSGLRADVVALSLAPDVSKLVKAGLVSPSWDKDRYKGMVTDSVVVLAVRKGNPKHIRGWSDLVKPGVQVITPNPFTSGGARWNVMAAYGAQVKAGRTPAQALAYLKALFKNVPVQDKSARESLQTFTGGKGDVLIAYENEAITAQRKGEEVDYVVPDRTVLIENPVAVTTNSSNPRKAREFVDYLRTPAAQRVFQSKGYRPVDRALLDKARFPTPKGLFTITDLGGWSTVTDQFFDPQKGSVAKIEQSLGVSTAK
ncbi:MAG: sulfate ABC transporter substrate-binding protein [Solirubrobacteraceae bacterium]